MNTKTIVIALVVIILIAVGGYAYYSMNNAAPAPEQNATTTPQTQPQVQAQEVAVGTGKTAEPGTKVSVLYTGRLQDGTVFDSSAAHGNAPLVFTLGAQGMIPGFQIGVNGMKVGGKRAIAIPPELGYGAQEVKDQATGKVIIPANSTLIFEVELVKVEVGSTTPAKQ